MSTFELYLISTLIPNLAGLFGALGVLLIIASIILFMVGGIARLESYNEEDKTQAKSILKNAFKFSIAATIVAILSVPIPDTKQMLIIYSGKLITNTKGTKELPENVVAVMNKLATDYLEEDKGDKK